MNKNCKVYYEDWQLQCCGDPFSVGDDIEQTAIAKHYKLPKHDVDIDFMEEHHLELLLSAKTQNGKNILPEAL